MLLLKVLATFCLSALVSADAAPVSRDSPRGVVYEANFRNGDVRGFLRFYSRNGVVNYVINVRGLPRQGGPFMYHVHQRRVPADGNCAGTLGHFNPYDGVLNAPTPAEFEVGDLSGKHGMIRGTSYRRTIEERFASLNPENEAFIGDLSIVFHLNDGKRIACANLVREGARQKRFSARYDNEKDEMDEESKEEEMNDNMEDAMDKEHAGVDEPQGDMEHQNAGEDADEDAPEPKLSKFVT